MTKSNLSNAQRSPEPPVRTAWAAGSTLTPGPKRSRRSSLRGGLAPYAFIAPFYVLYVLFMIIPILAALYLSLTEWVGLGTPNFIGLANYVNLVSDSSFATALSNSLVYTLVAVLVVVPCALLV